VKRALVVVIALAVLAFAGHIASAQSAVDVQSSTATIDFPYGIRFDLKAGASSAPSDVRLVYQIAPDGVRATAPAQCTGTTDITCGYELLGSDQNIIIPGAVVTYSWSMDVGGASQTTPDQQVTYQDTRFDWKTLTQGNMTLWYYSGSEDNARAVLAAGYDSEQKSSALLQTTVDYPVKLYLYRTAQDLQPAIQANNAAGVVTLGEVVYSDTAMISADASPQDIARHEVAHVVQRALLNGPYDAPPWLNEGMAVYEQSEPISGQREAVDAAIQGGNVISVRSMTSYSSGAQSGNVLLFYGEAWSLVKFLIDTYGDQKFSDLYKAIAAGSGTPGALQQVYGFNEDGLENAWRASVGLPPREAPTPKEDANATSAAPTQAENTNASSSSGDSSKVLVIAVVIVVTVLVAGGLLGLAFVVARR
jgi:hypothetical protein